MEAGVPKGGADLLAGGEDLMVSLDDFTVHGLVGEGEFGKVSRQTNLRPSPHLCHELHARCSPGDDGHQERHGSHVRHEGAPACSPARAGRPQHRRPAGSRAQVLRKEHLLFRGASSVKQAITEKQVLQEMAAKPHPYIVSLNFAFQDMVRLAGRSAARPAAQSPAARPLGPQGPVTA